MSDEQDAEAYTEERSKFDYYNASIDNRIYCAFLAGRRGMISVDEAEARCRVRCQKKSSAEVAEAIRLERERCAEIVRKRYDSENELEAVLNPSEEGK